MLGFTLGPIKTVVQIVVYINLSVVHLDARSIALFDRICKREPTMISSAATNSSDISMTKAQVLVPIATQ